MQNHTRIEARTLKGFKDFFPEETKTKYKIIDIIKKHALNACFLPIETPALEYAEILLGSGGEECDKEVYSFTDHGGRKIALRFDLTVPFARFISKYYHQFSFPFKRLHIGDVWRGEKPQKGRFRQFCQADLDIIGSDSIIADIEILQSIILILAEIIPSSFTVKIGNRVLLSGLIQNILQNNDPNKETKILIALDKIDKIGSYAVKELIKPLKFPEQQIDKLLDIINTTTSPIDYISQYLKTDSNLINELHRYQYTINLLRELIATRQNIKIQEHLGLARGLGYYTGIIFEINIDNLEGFGAISAGGRYDKLISRFSSRELTGVGGSIGVDRLLSALEELQTHINSNNLSFFIAIATENATKYAFNILNTLRTNNINADISMKISNLSAQFKYANKNNFDYVIIIGEDELKDHTLSIKNMKTGQQKKYSSIELLLQNINLK